MITSLGANEKIFEGEIKSMTLLGSGKAVDYERTAEGLVVQMPAKTNDYAVVAKLQLYGKLILAD